MGELPMPELVQYLARLGVAEVVPPGRLVPGQRPQSVPGRPWPQYHSLIPRDERVTPEERHVPRRPRRRHDQTLPRVEGERPKVLHAPLPTPPQLLPPRLERRRLPIQRRGPPETDLSANLLEDHRDAHGPLLARTETDVERETTQLSERLYLLPLDPHHGSPPEPLPRIGEAQMTVLRLLQNLAPLRRPAVAPHLVDVPEIRRALELDPYLDRHPGLVGEQDLLRHPIPEGAPPHHVHTLRPYPRRQRELGLRPSHPGAQRNQPRTPQPEAEPREVAHVPVEESSERAVEVPNAVRDAVSARRYNAHDPFPHTTPSHNPTNAESYSPPLPRSSHLTIDRTFNQEYAVVIERLIN
jgi:hypothetical protein